MNRSFEAVESINGVSEVSASEGEQASGGYAGYLIPLGAAWTVGWSIGTFISDTWLRGGGDDYGNENARG